MKSRKVAVARIPPKKLKLIHTLAQAEKGRLVEEKPDTVFMAVGTKLIYEFRSNSAAARWLVGSLLTLDRLSPGDPADPSSRTSVYNKLMKYWKTEEQKSDLTAFLDTHVHPVHPDTALIRFLKGE